MDWPEFQHEMQSRERLLSIGQLLVHAVSSIDACNSLIFKHEIFVMIIIDTKGVHLSFSV